MNTDAHPHFDSPRAIVGSCLILAIPSVSLSSTLNSGLTLGLTSAAILIILSPLRMDTSSGLGQRCMLAATFATLLAIVFGALWPSRGWDPGTFSLLVVFNVTLLGRSLGQNVAQHIGTRVKQTILTGALFIAVLALLLILKTLFGNAVREFAGSFLKLLHLPWLLYPGGTLLMAGMLYLVFGQKEVEK